MAKATHQGTCSVCFGTFKLTDLRPRRHGFSAVNIRHGMNGGWHTGPCGGHAFPHYGHSVEGTKWALANENIRLRTIVSSLEKHATRPELIWTRRASNGAYATKRHSDQSFLLVVGDKARRLDPDHVNGFPHWGDTVPSYEDRWNEIQAGLEEQRRQTGKRIVFYVEKIAEWKLSPATEV